MKTAGPILATLTGVGLLIGIVSSSYIINEGNVGVLTRMGKATSQEGPAGLRWKTPFITGLHEFDVRERTLEGELTAATRNQLPTNVQFSVNWRPDPVRVMEIFVNYGSPEEFAANTITPRLQQSLKATIGKFDASQMIREREAVAEAMLTRAKEVLEAYPALITSVQVENFDLPQRYMEAVLVKEEQRETTAREQLLLEQQAIQSKQTVQTAESNRDAQIAAADGAAYEREALAKAQAEATRLDAIAKAEATRVTAIAQAEAQRLIDSAKAAGVESLATALEGNAKVIDYQKALTWDGALPRMMMGGAPDLLMQLPTDAVN